MLGACVLRRLFALSYHRRSLSDADGSPSTEQNALSRAVYRVMAPTPNSASLRSREDDPTAKVQRRPGRGRFNEERRGGQRERRREVRPATAAEPLRFCDETSQRGDGKCDLLQLQSRYDALLHNPQAFSMQVQLLHACIQNAQQQLAKSVYMKELLPLQQRLRTPGTDACLQVHPLLYAAFCMYNPSHIRIAAAKRVGAAEHFLGEYLKARGSRGYRRRPVSEISRRGRAAADEWLAHTSLSNICIYPLEALSPQLRLFSLAAPQRLAAWEAILSRALAV
ncbi:LOW QUALITY PROTEIN: uncharacterized protein EMH_0068910 [Eimeria mitis]|uniref:Uncharacterized protein n=1 Tax=Eimeria mitis TaxID=44415 RepID=U6KHL9_9EIME|nr:LOW QUALITY PROTEIN: uncharacterized protein EMH_0068910 [Eimeria mitis]CDJ34953.1 hypothetical protein, conserved [Eimeria mitis]